MWIRRLQENYGSFQEWKEYSKTYRLAERIGFSSAVSAWHANPLIQGSVNPKDFRVVNIDDLYNACKNTETNSQDFANLDLKTALKRLEIIWNRMNSLGV